MSFRAARNPVIRGRMILILFGLAWCLPFGWGSQSAAQVEPLYAGLPEALPADYLKREGFVRFFQASGVSVAPIAYNIRINGERIEDLPRGTLDRIFDHTFFSVRLPDGMSIRIGTDAQGREIWDYPAGTEVAHQILLRTLPVATLYELRIGRKRADGRWAYGIYVPVEGEESLRLLTHRGLPPHSLRLEVSGSRPWNITMKRMGTEACRACHFAHSSSRYQFRNREEAGPCGFGPHNQELTRSWADTYFEKHGYRPFE